MPATRIKYTSVNNNLYSEIYNNYVGEKYKVMITADNNVTLSVFENEILVDEKINLGSYQNAKRLARKLLLDKYNVRLDLEVRKTVEL